MGFVDEQQRVVAAGDGVQLGQRGRLAVDGEHGVGHDEGALRRTT
jgi:hypothetical protein